MSNNISSKMKWAILGGGNGGQSAAAHLALQGFTVRLYDVIPATIEAISAKGGVAVEGAVSGFGKLEKATLDMDEAVDGADVIMIIAPALYHRDIAMKLATLVKPGQIVFIHPGATFGAIEFRQVFMERQAPIEDIAIAEAQSLVYACRAAKPGHANIIGMKKVLSVAALPARKTDFVMKALNKAYPQMYGDENVLKTSLTNLNAIMHPAPSLLNVGIIESEHEWEYYRDGITPSIGSYLEEMDKERLELGNAFGITLKPVLEMYREFYGVDKSTLSEAVKDVSAYRGIKGQKQLDTRYVLEDIPTGLIPMSSLAKQIGIKTPMIDTTINLGTFLLKRDFYSVGRTMERLGLSGLSKAELVRLLTLG